VAFLHAASGITDFVRLTAVADISSMAGVRAFENVSDAVLFL
jgi:hypothetical protein